MATLKVPNNGGPQGYVSVSVVLPKEYGGAIVTVVCDVPVDHYILGQGRGIDAMLDWAVSTARQELREIPRPVEG